MECRAYGICLDSQSRGYLGKDRKVSSAAGGNLSRMHKTEETAKESRLNFMYSHLRNRTLEANRKEVGFLTCEFAISDDRQVCHIYERFQDSAAIMNHLQSFGANLPRDFSKY